MSMKHSSHTIGNRARDLPACSAVPQPNAPPRASIVISDEMEMISKVETVYGVCKVLFVIFFLSEGPKKNTKTLVMIGCDWLGWRS